MSLVEQTQGPHRPATPGASSGARHARNFLALGVGNYGAIAASMAINAVLTRRLGVESFGRLALLLTTSQVIALLSATWTQSAAVRFGAIELSSVGTVTRTFWTRVWVALPWAAALAMATAVGGTRLATYLGVPAWGLAVVWVHFLAALVLTSVGAVFQARQEMSRYGAALFFDKAVMVVMLLALPMAWMRDPLTVLATYAVSSLSVAIVCLSLLGSNVLLPVVFSAVAYRQMWAYSSPLILSNWASTFGTSWFDLIVLRWYRAPEELGWYSLGTLLAGVLQQVAIISSTLLLPQLSVLVAAGDFDELRRMIRRLLPYWYLAISVLYGLALIVGTKVVPLVFGAAFTPSVSVFAVLMLASTILALFSIFATLMSALGATWALTGIGFLSGAVNVAGDLWLIPRYGTVGSAIATALSYAVGALAVMLFVQRRLAINVLLLGWLGLPALSTAVLFFWLQGAAFSVAATLTGAVLSMLLVRQFGLFGREDTIFIRRLRLSALWSTR